jgi:hypothetical protein
VTSDKGHGRRERRTLTSTIGLNRHLDWPQVGQVCRVVRERFHRGACQVETAYYITSLRRHQADAKRLLELTRGHWAAIENGLHYVRDTTLDEDRCTIFRGHAAQNLAALRNAALNWLRRRGALNLAAAIRSFTRQSQRLFSQLGYVK